VGHSLGGSIASKFVEKVEANYPGKIQGLVVIDVVEGTALEALPFMVSIV
jgi:protein phosphatase methylesterase 1